VPERAPLREESPYPRAVAIAMRATGVVALVFIAYHVLELRLAASRPRADELYTVLAGSLSATSGGAPLRAMFYVVGIAAVAFHFAAGLWGFAIARGWARTQGARRAAAVAFGAVGVTSFVVATDVVTMFTTGARLFGPSAVTPVPLEPGPCPAPPPSPSSSK